MMYYMLLYTKTISEFNIQYKYQINGQFSKKSNKILILLNDLQIME